MRWFKVAAVALLGLTTTPTAAIGRPQRKGPNDITDVTGSIDQDHVSIDFSTSCTGCFVGTNNGLQLNLVIPKSHGECLGPNPVLNGVPLDQRWVADQAHGESQIPAQLLNGLGERQIHIIWRSMCVQGEGQLLSVRVLEVVDGGKVQDASGFTVSFKQSGNPTVLRLRNENTHLGRLGHHLNSWLQPSEELRLRINANDAAAPSALDAEFAKLEKIKHRMATLHAVMRQQEQTIVHMLKKDFKHCDGFQCMLQTAMQKAPDFAHLIAEHFSHEEVKLMKHAQSEEIAFVNTPTSPASSQESRPHQENPASPPFGGDHRPHPPFEGDHPHPPFQGGHPPPEHHGEHPPSPPHHGEHPPPHPPSHNGDQPPPHHGDGPHGPPGRHYHGRPPFFQRIRYHRFRILKATLALFGGLCLMSILFKTIRNHLPCSRDPRRRADQASRREERRTRCQYRRAAHQHRLRSWWAAHNPRRASVTGTADYDEKRTLILAQEGILEEAMQSEIRNLQTAAELEEGRAGLYNGVSTLQELEGHASSSGLRRQNSYPASDYSTPPPRYEAELDDEIIPVNGFGYSTPSNTDETPESSVVDFSPRMSCDTLLTNTTKSERLD